MATIGHISAMQVIKTAAEESDDSNPAELFATLLHGVTNAHILHLRARSLAEHMAMDEVYSGLPGLIDALVEAYQGRRGIVEDYPGEYTAPEKSALEFVQSLRSKVTKSSSKLGSYSELQNIVDEIVALLDKAAYKLEFLT